MGITIEDLPVEDLHPNPNNPRRQVGDVADLEASIRSQGIKQPLLVTPTGETDISTGMRSTESSSAIAGSPPPNRPDLSPCRRSSKGWTRGGNARSCWSRTRNAPI